MLVKQNLRFNTAHPGWREGRPCWHAECEPPGSLDKSAFRSLLGSLQQLTLSRISSISLPGLSKPSNSRPPPSVLTLTRSGPHPHDHPHISRVHQAINSPTEVDSHLHSICSSINARNWWQGLCHHRRDEHRRGGDGQTFTPRRTSHRSFREKEGERG